MYMNFNFDIVFYEDLFWDSLSENENAIEILEMYKEHINWESLSKNKNAMNLLMTHRGNIDYIIWEKTKINLPLISLKHILNKFIVVI